MTVTTEEAHKLWRALFDANWHKAAGALRSLAAERDALKAENANLQDDLASAERERAHQQGRADRNAAEYAREQKKREQLQAENAQLQGLLSECNSWVTAAIECKNWTWDWDQKEAAIFARDQARAALGEKE
jgi:hypothetical protein